MSFVGVTYRKMDEALLKETKSDSKTMVSPKPIYHALQLTKAGSLKLSPQLAGSFKRWGYPFPLSAHTGLRRERLAESGVLFI